MTNQTKAVAPKQDLPPASPNKMSLRNRIRPKQGFAHFFHIGFNAILPIIVYVFVRLDLTGVALAVILLAKWRIFAVRPRHWFAHLRTNAVDIIFSVSMLGFMVSTNSLGLQLLWVLVYEVWLLYVKPGSSPLKVSIQALLAQLAGMLALFSVYGDAPLAALITATAIIGYFSARHFFNSFEEHHLHTYSWVWALFSACLIWLLGHWLLFYGPIAQPALLIGVIGYSLAALYYLAETDKLSKLVQRQVVFVALVIVGLVLVLSRWRAQTG